MVKTMHRAFRVKKIDLLNWSCLILGLYALGALEQTASEQPLALRRDMPVLAKLMLLRAEENSLFMAIPPSFQKALTFIPLCRDVAVEVLSFCDFEYESEAQFVQMEFLREQIKEAERTLPLKKKK